MEMRRKVYEKLLEWKRLDHGTSAVLINGARRVAQMLTAAGRKLYFFSRSSATDRKERMEVDFLLAKSKLAKKNNIRPVEVKSGKHTTHRSLDKFRSKYADWLDTPCLLWDKDLKVDGGITYLPLYMAPLIG